jgi:ribosomal silencing factor RsfS
VGREEEAARQDYSQDILEVDQDYSQEEDHQSSFCFDVRKIHPGPCPWPCPGLFVLTLTSISSLPDCMQRPIVSFLYHRFRCFSSIASSGISDKAALEVLASFGQTTNDKQNDDQIASGHKSTATPQENQRRRAIWSETWSEDHLTDEAKKANVGRAWGSWGSLTNTDLSPHVGQVGAAHEEKIDPTSEFSPVRSLSDARKELRWSIASLLRQRGFKNQDSGSPNSIALLSRKALNALAVDCGLSGTKHLNQHQLATLLSSIVGQEAQKDQRKPDESHTSTLYHTDLSNALDPLPARVKSWLLESHCFDVFCFDTTSSGGHPSYTILATANSQRQAYSSCFAVKSQAKDLCPSSPPQLIGARGIDWISVFIDQPDISIGVHVLTERARAFYMLDEILQKRCSSQWNPDGVSLIERWPTIFIMVRKKKDIAIDVGSNSGKGYSVVENGDAEVSKVPAHAAPDHDKYEKKHLTFEEKL